MLQGWLLINFGVGSFFGSAVGSWILTFERSECCSLDDQSCCGVDGVNVLVGTSIAAVLAVVVVQYFFLPKLSEYEDVGDLSSSSDDESQRPRSYLLN
mmetsp:Transcript_35816/g.100797  ORF Transcript_35816/g.100797 Transcript_35816/m.100797 type:complete len:98 (+) Transcript_35816:391-684(+)